MKRRMMVVATLLVAIGAGSLLQGGIDPAEDHEAIKQAVLMANDAMVQASSERDVDGFFAHILDSDTGLIIQDGVLFKTRKEAYQAVKRGFEGVSKIERVFDQTHVTIVSPECAVLTGAGMSTVSLDDGRRIENSFAVSQIFVLKEGQWKLLQGHFSVPNPR